jgi:hypothetical protein
MARLGWVLAVLLAAPGPQSAQAQLAEWGPARPGQRMLAGDPPGFVESTPFGASAGYRPPMRPSPVPIAARWPEPDALSDEVLATDGFPAVDEFQAMDDAVDLEALVDDPAADTLGGFLGYRYETSSTDWVVGNGDQFGMFSLDWEHYVDSGIHSGLGLGAKIHFLAGPERADMPPRAFDFSLAYQKRDRLGPFGYDVAASVMASSDFEGSAREGIRFPGHAVGFLEVHPTTELVFGVDYLDRGDLKILPVAGLILFPNAITRLEFLFPRPRAVFRLTDDHRLYVAGELGGGTWVIERVVGRVFDDLATYRDLRLSLGLEWVKKDGNRSALEIGYLFDRRLEYTSGTELDLDDTVLLRVVETF